MSKAKSREEEELTGEKEESFKGTPDKAPYGIDTDLPEGMKRPDDPGEHEMGGVHKGSDSHMSHSGMSDAVRHLEMDTERGSYVPEVGGMKAHGHSGKLVKE